MKKKKIKGLTLKRETIRQMDEPTLRFLPGGTCTGGVSHQNSINCLPPNTQHPGCHGGKP